MKLVFFQADFQKFSDIKFHRPVGAELFPPEREGWTDRQAGMTELIVAFRNFADAPKKKGA